MDEWLVDRNKPSQTALELMHKEEYPDDKSLKKRMHHSYLGGYRGCRLYSEFLFCQFLFYEINHFSLDRLNISEVFFRAINCNNLASIDFIYLGF